MIQIHRSNILSTLLKKWFQLIGHYRVNYDLHNWGLLIKQLTENPEKIHPLNRAQLIDDSFSLAFDDHLPYDIPLKLGEYLINETEILPLRSAAYHLDMLFSKYEQTKNCILFHVCVYFLKFKTSWYNELHTKSLI